MFDQMLAAGVHPDSYTCCALMHAHAVLGEYRAVEELLAKLPEWKVRATSHAFAALMTAYVEAHEIGRAVALWQGINSQRWQGPPASAHTLSILLCGLGKIVSEQPGAIEVAEALYAEASDGEGSMAAQELPRACTQADSSSEELLAKWWSFKDERGHSETLAGLRSGVWGAQTVDPAPRVPSSYSDDRRLLDSVASDSQPARAGGDRASGSSSSSSQSLDTSSTIDRGGMHGAGGAGVCTDATDGSQQALSLIHI